MLKMKKKVEGHDHFHINHPDINWESQIEHGKKIELGNFEYELIEMK